jgi:prephenate dehydrogenase
MHLQRFQYFLMKRDVKELHNIMTEANRIREILNGIELKQPKGAPTSSTVTDSNQ